MSAGASGAIGPVSVRYAAQIRELLFAQALQRIVADQEAARAEAAAKAAHDSQPRKHAADGPAETSSSRPAGAATERPAETQAATPRLVNIQA